MNTFYQLWGVTTPKEARAMIESQRLDIVEPKNLEEQALSLVGSDIYEKLIKGYTEKQWGCKCSKLPAFIIKRLPLRFTYDNNYFNDKYQGIPVGGYTRIFEKLLNECDLRLNTEYKKGDIDAGHVIFTGAIDEYYEYKYGTLEYRSLSFEQESFDSDNVQGNALINYTTADVPYTRSIEHKHFEFGKQATSIISREYTKKWSIGDERYYPVNDDGNNALYERYRKLADCDKDILFGGRMGTYKYMDMDDVIKSALILSHRRSRI
jgi:UDP-galactopyranose mutase